MIRLRGLQTWLNETFNIGWCCKLLLASLLRDCLLVVPCTWALRQLALRIPAFAWPVPKLLRGTGNLRVSQDKGTSRRRSADFAISRCFAACANLLIFPIATAMRAKLGNPTNAELPCLEITLREFHSASGRSELSEKSP